MAALDDVDLAKRTVTSLAGVGPKIEQRLKASGIGSVADLLYRLPVRFQDRTRIWELGDLEPGVEAYFEAEVVRSTIRFGRMRTLLCNVADATGELNLRFFHFGEGQRRSLSTGARIAGYGEVRAGREGLEVVHPEYRLLTAQSHAELEATLTPVYAPPEGIGQATMRKLVTGALNALAAGGEIADTLPTQVRREFNLIAIDEALRLAHRPEPVSSEQPSQSAAATEPIRRRLALDELLAHHLSLRQHRALVAQNRAPLLAPVADLEARFLAALPFALTAAQERALAEVGDDFMRQQPMHRLIQGDVGSGKTVVAALAALRCIGNGYQCAFMAPTEILAEQHLLNLRAWLEPFGIEVGWLAGKMRAKHKRETLAALATGAMSLVVGTHALVQQNVSFARLGLAVIDEQHRFGVDQRLRLSGGEFMPDTAQTRATSAPERPHLLLMTATPIPRTLAMVAFADLDTSVLDELPPGRTPVATAIIAATRREQIIERTAQACRSGQQAYWICPLVEESDELDCQAATETAQTLAATLPDLRVGLVHGRLSSAEKDAVMSRFKAGAIDWLVATTVVEVGVDVPNASVMVIENAERLGLSQLHQLRGRVGRGARKSACVLLYSAPLSTKASERLAAIRATNDGFVIAERDLELRGPGELLGVRQAGSIDYRHADLMRDSALLPSVERLATMLLDNFPDAAAAHVQRWMGERAKYISA